jgi:ABC-2 type transport system permease protein
MSTTATNRFVTLLRRELREYRNSLFWTPVITAVLLGLVMLVSVLLANRISIVGQTILDALMADRGNSVNISVSVGDDGEREITVIDIAGVDPEYLPPKDMQIDIRSVDGSGEAVSSSTQIAFERAPNAPPAAPVPPRSYRVIADPNSPDELWNFSREWSFNPQPREKDVDGSFNDIDMDGRELNVILSVVHAILVLILLLTSVNYLLDSLYSDRKDRSILFWRSMPVGEWEIVLSKLATALVVAPLIYIAISLLLQLAWVLLMMLLVWRMDESPFEVVVQNIDFVALMLDPISGWIMTALLIAPTYAWLLCASALAKRSPFLMAITPVIALFVVEAVFLGSEHWGNAVQNHLPHATDSSAVGFYLFGPNWMSVDLLSVGAGLLFTVAALSAAVWLRRHRWEL